VKLRVSKVSRGQNLRDLISESPPPQRTHESLSANKKAKSIVGEAISVTIGASLSPLRNLHEL